MPEDKIDHPIHYTWIPGIECKDVVGGFSYNAGSAMAYIWRHMHKGKPISDLKKAIKHLEFEISQLKKDGLAR